MAQFVKAVAGEGVSSTIVKLTRADNVENFTVYLIEINLGQWKWTVSHRYSEFRQLHEKLVQQYKLEKSLLPPKKLFGNQAETFIKKRQAELEIYLQALLRDFSVVPPVLAQFLDFPKYEIHGITQELAHDLFQRGDVILNSKDVFTLSPLQLHALTTRLTLAEPTCESGDVSHDLGHILDFVSRLKYLKIEGSEEKIGSSNIISNQLNFDLTCFKSLHSLELVGCCLSHIHGVELIKKSLRKLIVHRTINTLHSVLLMDVEFGQWQGVNNEAALVPAWVSLNSADVSRNNITAIDESMKLMPRVEVLDLSHNKLSEVKNLHHLSGLTKIDLSNNVIHNLSDLHRKLGNVKVIDLAFNKIESLFGFSRLYALEILDLSNNDISQVTEVKHLSNLPCLEKLTLSNNPITIILDYRTRILEMFDVRAPEIELDGQKSSQKELDTVAVRIALNKAKASSQSKQHKKRTKQLAKEALIQEAPARSSSVRPDTLEVNSHASSSSSSAHTLPTVALHPSTMPNSGPSFRGEVEQMRAKGGIAWLSILNKSRESSPQGSGRQSPVSVSPDTSNVQSEPRDQTSTSPSQVALGYQPFIERLPWQSSDFILPETLPGRNDSALITHLQMLTPEIPLLTRRERREKQEEIPVFLTWSSVIFYTEPYSQPPACIYLTSQKLHVFEVTSLRGSSSYPQLSRMNSLPLPSIEQVVLGYHNLYLRVDARNEEGTFTILTGSENKTNQFLDALKLAYRRGAQDLDLYEDPRIICNSLTEDCLLEVLRKFDRHVKILMYQLIQTVDPTSDKKIFITMSLVISSEYLYLLREDYITWPPPLFASYASGRPQFEVIGVFPIMSRITGIHLYDTDTRSPEDDSSLPQNFSVTQFNSMIVPNFIGFGIRLDFDLGKYGNQTLDIRVPTSGMRDKFLGTFTHVRREMSEKSPSPAKVKHKHVPSPSGVERKVDGNMKVHVNEDTKKEDFSAHEIDDPVSIQNEEESSDTSSSNIPLVRESPIGQSTTTLNSACQSASAYSSSVSSEERIQIDLADKADDLDVDGECSPVDDSSHLQSADTETYLRFQDTCEDLVESAPVISVTRQHSPPSSLPGLYPNVKLLSQLSQLNEEAVLASFSPALHQMMLMSGEELLNYFHSSIAQIGTSGEELRHILWTSVVTYHAPFDELPMCVMLSTKALYFISDEASTTSRLSLSRSRVETVKTHCRHRSDSYQAITRAKQEIAHVESSGVIHHAATQIKQKVPRCFHMLLLTDLKEVNLGLFDQSIRLCGDVSEDVLTCITRDAHASEMFVNNLMSVLSLLKITPSPVKSAEEPEDFYSKFNSYQRIESVEYRHPSKVSFIYPNDDTIGELVFLVSSSTKSSKKSTAESCTILLYLLPLLCVEDSDNLKQTPTTLVVTSNAVAMAREDHVSYPIPPFCRTIPEQPRWEVSHVHSFESLQKLIVSPADDHEVSLVFCEDGEEIVVDTSVEHFSPKADESSKADVPQVKFTFWIQKPRDKERLVKIICQQWSECHHGHELPVNLKV